MQPVGRKTELIWEGKYDANGKRVAPLRVQLPFQTVEMVNESAQQRQRALSLFESPGAYLAKEWRNRLIWGDKKYVLPALLPEFAGRINLIYIDPPFDTGADFSFTANVPDQPDASDDESFVFTKEPSIIEQKAYRDQYDDQRKERVGVVVAILSATPSTFRRRSANRSFPFCTQSPLRSFRTRQGQGPARSALVLPFR